MSKEKCKIFKGLLINVETEVQVEAGNQKTLNDQLVTINEEINNLAEQKPAFEVNVKKFYESIELMESKVKELSSELENLRQDKEKSP